MEKSVDQSKVNQLWELLVRNEILSLPDQKKLEDRMIIYKVDTTDLYNENARSILITDGILYSFELSTPNMKRFYSYGNPHGHLKHYSNIKELYHAVVIILLIEKFLGRPLVVS